MSVTLETYVGLVWEMGLPCVFHSSKSGFCHHLEDVLTRVQEALLDKEANRAEFSKSIAAQNVRVNITLNALSFFPFF